MLSLFILPPLSPSLFSSKIKIFAALLSINHNHLHLYLICCHSCCSKSNHHHGKRIPHPFDSCSKKKIICVIIKNKGMVQHWLCHYLLLLFVFANNNNQQKKKAFGALYYNTTTTIMTDFLKGPYSIQ